MENMFKPFLTENELIFQLQVKLERDAVPVIVDIAYSGTSDETGKMISEFEWASVTSDSNPGISEDVLNDLSENLENGLEEQIVRWLILHYKNTSINFDPNEYKGSL